MAGNFPLTAASLAVVGDLVGARGGAVEPALDLLPGGFQRRVVGLARNENRIARHHRQPPERQVECALVPVVEFDAALGGDRHRIDRPAGMLRQLHHAHAGDARHFRHVGGERDVPPLRERFQHFGEGHRAALAVEFAVMRAGAADGADAKPHRRARVDLAVAVARDQHLGAMPAFRTLDERRHEMLAVPHGDDRRHLHRVVDVRRLKRDAAGVPDQLQIARRQGSDGFLKGG